MPNSELAKEEKIKFWKLIEKDLGRMISMSQDWRITENKTTSIIVKFSKYDDKSRSFWYGLNPDNLDKWSNYNNSYLVFLIGKHEERLVIPINKLKVYIRDASIKHSKGNQIKLHIISEGNQYIFTEFRNFDVSEFYQTNSLANNEENTVFKDQGSFQNNTFGNESIPKTLLQLEDEVEFDPKNIKDAREKIYTSIAVRRGQRKFRKLLLDAYERKCAITGCTIEEILEAAHIIPYKGSHTNKLANGILLRADLHTLFDLGLITVDTNTMTVNISSKLVNTEYNFLKASKLKVKSDILQVVKLALDEHQNTFRITDYSKKK